MIRVFVIFGWIYVFHKPTNSRYIFQMISGRRFLRGFLQFKTINGSSYLRFWMHTICCTFVPFLTLFLTEKFFLNFNGNTFVPFLTLFLIENFFLYFNCNTFVPFLTLFLIKNFFLHFIFSIKHIDNFVHKIPINYVIRPNVSIRYGY